MTVVALLFAGIAEGLGISVFIPLLNLILNPGGITGGGGGSASSGIETTLESVVGDILASFGVAHTVAGLLVIFVACIVLKCGLILLANKQVGYTVAHIATDLRLRLLRALFVTRWEYFLGQPIGKLTNAVATEANRSALAFSFGAKMASICIEALVYAALALLVSWQATVIALGVGVVIIFALRRFVKKARRAGKKQTQLLQALVTQMTDSLQSIKSLKAMGREQSADSVLNDKSSRLNRALQKQVISKAALGAVQEPLIMAFLAIILYITLIHLKISLVTVLAMVYLIRRVLKNVQKMQQEYQNMAIFDSAYWSLQEKIREAEKERESALGDREPVFNRNIRLEAVGFAYEKSWILDAVDLELPSGAFVALVGPSGAGKTTVADLIIGLLRPQKGEVWIDDMPLSEVDIRRWRRMIGYVPQETLLLHDTVLVNVTLGDPNVSEAAVEKALRASGAWGFVSKLPEGLHTVVGERGSKVSGGQRQRIAIARALVGHPRVLILDEATTALDPETEAAICDTLCQLQGQVTILAISHQSAMLDAAEIAYRLEGGSVTLLKTGKQSRREVDGRLAAPQAVIQNGMS